MPSVAEVRDALLRLGWRSHRRETMHLPLYLPGTARLLTLPADGELSDCMMAKVRGALRMSETEFRRESGQVMPPPPPLLSAPAQPAQLQASAS